LPSLNLRFHLNDEMQLRFGASQSMVRPNFSQMNGFTSLSFDFRLDGGGVPVLNSLANFPVGSMPDGNPTPLSGFGGNPYLEPTVSDNLDASLEWYFNSGGSVTLALFHKEIQDYIVVAPDLQQFTFGGETLDFAVNRQVNSDDGTLQGFELAFQKFFDFLPGPLSGFGLQANYTYIDNEGGANNAVNPFDPNQVTNAAGAALPLEGISPTSYNITGMYEKYGFSARLAYNWRERYLVTTSAANLNVPVWWEDYGQLDGSIFYNITDDVKIGLQAQNLLGSRTYLEISSNDPNVSPTSFTPRHQWSDTDTRYTFSVRAQF
jgi:TonB-dependent receptor